MKVKKWVAKEYYKWAVKNDKVWDNECRTIIEISPDRLIQFLQNCDCVGWTGYEFICFYCNQNELDYIKGIEEYIESLKVRRKDNSYNYQIKELREMLKKLTLQDIKDRQKGKDNYICHY